MIHLLEANEVKPLWYPLPAGAPEQVAARIDGLFEDEIRGWAIDVAEPNRLLTVVVRINGAFAGKCTACIYRQELASLTGSIGLHGFAFRVPERYFAAENWDVEVMLEDGRYIGPRPLRISSPSSISGPLQPVTHPCLLFIHIPKTAGTSLRTALNRQRHISRYLALYPDAPGFPGEYIFHLTESQMANFECIYGHFGFRLHQFLPQPCEYSTVLREPIARSISHFSHRRRMAPAGHPLSMLTAEEFFAGSPDVNFDNLMTRLISGETADILPLGGVNEAVFQHAIENLHTRFAYVGIHEQIGEAARQLAYRVGLPHQALQPENVGDGQGPQSVSPATLDAIRGMNEYDVRLYAYVRHHYWATGQKGWVRPPSSSIQKQY